MNQAISTHRSAHLAIYIAVGILVFIVGMVAFIASRPADFRIERSAQINAPSDVVYPLINDLHQWQRWSPYEKLDPNVKKTYEGPAAGPGASYAWNGNSQAGEGVLTILESKPDKLVTMDLKFTRPFACNNQVNFQLVPSGSGTRVSWIMEGKNSFIGKAFSTFMNMDKMVGAQFEEGLANLNTLAQSENQQTSAPQDSAANP